MVRMIKGIQLFSVQKIFICLLISECHLTFTIIFYYHAVMNAFIQWKETTGDAYLTDTLSCFPFIEPNISPLPQGSLASIPINVLISFSSSFFSVNFLPLTCSIRNVLALLLTAPQEFIHKTCSILYVFIVLLLADPTTSTCPS